MSFSSDDLVKVMITDQKLQLYGDANMHVSHIYDYRSKAAVALDASVYVSRIYDYRSKAAAAWGCKYAYLTYL
jgi:hypothetical protein